jgi:hypothetical protein
VDSPVYGSRPRMAESANVLALSDMEVAR